MRDLLLYDEKFGKADDTQVLRWKVAGAHNAHKAFAAELMNVPTVVEFDY